MDESIAANRIFPNSVEYKWNTDDYGPLMIPSKGLEIEINTDNLSKYGSVITDYEKNKNTTIEDGILYIDNQIVESYTFKQDYFFMMGDNRHNSEDSRFWGFVPYDHILGEASFIWFSFNYQEENIFKAIRWSRFFNVIR